MAWWQQLHKQKQPEEQINFRLLEWNTSQKVCPDLLATQFRNSCWPMCFEPYLGIITTRKMAFQLFVSYTFSASCCLSFMYGYRFCWFVFWLLLVFRFLIPRITYPRRFFGFLSSALLEEWELLGHKKFRLSRRVAWRLLSGSSMSAVSRWSSNRIFGKFLYNKRKNCHRA